MTRGGGTSPALPLAPLPAGRGVEEDGGCADCVEVSVWAERLGPSPLSRLQDDRGWGGATSPALPRAPLPAGRGAEEDGGCADWVEVLVWAGRFGPSPAVAAPGRQGLRWCYPHLRCRTPLSLRGEGLRRTVGVRTALRCWFGRSVLVLRRCRGSRTTGAGVGAEAHCPADVGVRRGGCGGALVLHLLARL